jgi:hypothetical protein
MSRRPSERVTSILRGPIYYRPDEEREIFNFYLWNLAHDFDHSASDIWADFPDILPIRPRARKN